MFIFVLAIVALALFKSDFYLGKGYDSNLLFENALERNVTDSIKGIFILYVVMRHAVPYIPNEVLGNTFDHLYLVFNRWVRQLLVVMFLFYSGYGVGSAIINKGKPYVNSIPTKRFLTTLINFDIAVLFFIILNLFLGISMSLKETLLSFTGWSNIGNSNWYIFCILILYATTYAAFKLRITPPNSCIVLIISTLAYMVIIGRYKQHWWVDTVFCYPLGLLFALYKNQFRKIFTFAYWPTLIIFTILFFITYHCQSLPFVFPGCKYVMLFAMNIYAMLFALIVVMITMRWQIHNNILKWCGVCLFPIYIYQRLPMIFLENIGSGTFPAAHPYFFIVISYAVTMIIAYFHKYINIRIR